MIVVFILAFICLLGAMYHILLSFNAGVFPSRYILQKRAVGLGIGSALLFLIGFLFRI